MTRGVNEKKKRKMPLVNGRLGQLQHSRAETCIVTVVVKLSNINVVARKGHEPPH